MNNCYVVTLVGTVFLEVWKRHSATLAYRWDVTSFEDLEPQRPEFYGTDTRPVSSASVRY